MRVAEKDKAVRGLLEEEYRRCRDVLIALAKDTLSEVPYWSTKPLQPTA